jgi:hypothetical protein
MLCLYFTIPVHANLPNTSNLKQLQTQTLLVTSDFSPSYKDITQDDFMQSFVQLYSDDWGHYTEELLGKAIYYFPLFSYHLEKADLPDAFKYLPLIESHLNKDVTSSRGAKGLWQFMPATARHYGLEVAKENDERTDPQQSTAAAAQMLKDLYQDFDDWKLVLAAYNCGPGRVRRAIRKANASSYDEIAPYLPRQTRNYLKKFMAIVYIGKHYDSFGLTPKMEAEKLSTQWTSVSINGQQNLKTLAQLANINYGFLRQLNADWKPQNKTNKLVLPAYAKVELNKIYTAINGSSLDHLAQAGSLPILSDLLWENGTNEPYDNYGSTIPSQKDARLVSQKMLAALAVLPRKALLS